MAEGVQSAEQNGRRRFAAFISYAHADAAIASKLQAKLERYRLPKHLAQSHTGGEAALGRIFRDRADLAAAPSLSEAIRDAISQAEALIVICSPDAVASRWVGEEIALFRSLHPDRPILAAVVRGAPEEAFPAALTEGGNEPLAADLRKEADGPSLGFLKIVAGIAGVPLDALIQRDAQRRIRRVMWITGSALAAMLIMAIMTTLALSARNEAARQRAEAEGLVEYMLTDLREKLKGVGRLDVMGAVNNRAMEHYRRHGDISKLSTDSLERRARILHAMGEDDDKNGHLDQAAIKFREAHRTTNSLLKREPNSPSRVFAHAQSEYWVGQAAWRRSDRKTAQVYWSNYLKQAQHLIRIDPNRYRANLEMGYALGNLCDLYLKDNFDLAKAANACLQSISYKQIALKLSPSSKEVRMALANRYGWMADVYIRQKKFSEARKARLLEQTIIDDLLRDDPRNFELRSRRLWPDLGLGLIAFEEGQYSFSADHLLQVSDKFAELSREVPGNFEVKRYQARAIYTRAKSLVYINSIEAESELKRVESILIDISKMPDQMESINGFRRAINETRIVIDERNKNG